MGQHFRFGAENTVEIPEKFQMRMRDAGKEHEVGLHHCTEVIHLLFVLLFPVSTSFLPGGDMAFYLNGIYQT